MSVLSIDVNHIYKKIASIYGRFSFDRLRSGAKRNGEGGQTVAASWLSIFSFSI